MVVKLYRKSIMIMFFLMMLVLCNCCLSFLKSRTRGRRLKLWLR